MNPPDLSTNVFQTRNTHVAAYLAKAKEVPFIEQQPLIAIEDANTGNEYQVWQFVAEHNGKKTKDLAQEFEENKILEQNPDSPDGIAAGILDTYNYLVKHARDAHPLIRLSIGRKVILVGKGSKQHKALLKKYPHHFNTSESELESLTIGRAVL